MRVWITAREWFDCGEDFEVGSEIEWYLFPLSREERVYNLQPLGDELLESVTHSTSPDELIPTEQRSQSVRMRGRVESILVVYFRWARAPRWRPHSNQQPLASSPLMKRNTWLGPRTYRPLIGGAVLEARECPDFRSDPDLGSPEGYIVEISQVD